MNSEKRERLNRALERIRDLERERKAIAEGASAHVALAEYLKRELVTHGVDTVAELPEDIKLHAARVLNDLHSGEDLEARYADWERRNGEALPAALELMDVPEA